MRNAEGKIQDARRILLIEDDLTICNVVCELLSHQGFDVLSSRHGSDSTVALAQSDFDLVICDLMLPGKDGEEITRLIRQSGSTVPLLIISAKNSPADKVKLLTAGADDYLSKPFDLEELLARVKAQLRRSRMPLKERSVLTYGEWQLFTQERVLRIQNGKIELTKTEYNIIELLMRHPKRVFTRPELFEYAWNSPYRDDANTVNTHMSHLRSKLKPSGTDAYIKTMWGIGFKLSVEEA